MKVESLKRFFVMSFAKSNERTPLEKFCISATVIRYLAGPLGMNWLLPDFRFTWNLFSLYAATVLYYICEFSTGYKLREDPFVILEIICLNGLAVPVSFDDDFRKTHQFQFK